MYLKIVYQRTYFSYEVAQRVCLFPCLIETGCMETCFYYFWICWLIVITLLGSHF